MNLFSEEKRQDKTDIYYQELENKLNEQWNNHVRIRMDVRHYLMTHDLTPILKQLTEKILIGGKPDYQNTQKLFNSFLDLINPDQPPKD